VKSGKEKLVSAKTSNAVASGRSFVKNFSYVPVNPAFWRKDFWSFFDYRDLGLHGASKGDMSAEHLRFNGETGASTGWYHHDLEFDWLYVLKGHVSIVYQTGDSANLHANDAILLPSGFCIRFFDFSPDFEALEIRAPAKARITRLERPIRDVKPAAAKPVISRDSPQAHVIGEGLRRFFSYRDLGIAELTNRKFQLHVITVAEQPPGGTGWHIHKAGQFAFVLDGWATVALKGQAALHYQAGDSISVCPEYGHDVPEFSMKYKVIELIAPADYDTIAID
jgi:quercetin dioxygenase-like cupin family protein